MTVSAASQRARGRVFTSIENVEQFLREDCTVLRTQLHREAIQQSAADIDALAPGILTIKVAPLTITDLMFADGSCAGKKTPACACRESRPRL